MENLIGKELYCAKTEDYDVKFAAIYGKPIITLPTVGKLYTVRGVWKYPDTNYISITLMEIVNPPIGGNPFIAGSGAEPYFPLPWFGDLAELSIEAVLEEALELV